MTETQVNRRSYLILICIIASIIFHLILVYINLKHQFTPSFKPAPRPIPQKQNPMTMMQQPPRRIHQAGTGKNAPKTTKALSIEETKPPRLPLPPQQPTQPSAQKQVLPPEQPPAQKPLPKEAQKPPERKLQPSLKKPLPQAQPPKQKLSTGRLPIKKFFEDARKKEQYYRQQQPADTQKTLSFLSPDNLYQAMRDRAIQEQDPAQTTQQYGDMKYLHYNRKIYQALQQAMNIVVRNLSRTQYQSALDQIHHPTRIRFALDKNGKLKNLHIITSSGNPQYDRISQKVIQEASFPPIPKSFNMHTTYHSYGIILYNDGSPRNSIGVSPYLEGE